MLTKDASPSLTNLSPLPNDFLVGQKELMDKNIRLKYLLGKEGRVRCTGELGMPDFGASGVFCMITFFPHVSGRTAQECCV